MPKYARDSFNLSTSPVDSECVVDTLSGAPREEGLTLAFAGGKEAGTRGCRGGVWGEYGLEWGMPQKEQDGGCFSLGVTGGTSY